ncbi:glycoside hydrolase family 64 protein [Streptomyces sp. NPDC020898]|uniref:glycoside hydrolase family 64 protein n=1 Tax=Streptomyces sp. NPDC020898 TaxID=3365101 RepID=UPI0037BA6436
MFATRKVLVPLVAAAAVATGLTAAGPASRAEAAVPTTIPLEFKNNSGRGDQIYVYNIGTELSTGRQGWADTNGTFHAWPAGGNPPTPAPDASIAGPANGRTMTLRMPKFSGRVYFSYGQKLVFRLTTGGLVQPAVQNPSDPNANILFNWTEYTLNDSGLWLNSTQVDMFSAPYAVGVKNTAGTVKNTGHLKSGGYAGFFNSLRAQPGGWAGLIRTRSDGTILRALAPGHGIEAGALPSTVMNDYVNRVWTKYAGSTLTVTPFADQPGTKYYGRVSGNVMNFTNSSGTVVTSFQKPDADSIFGCYKLLDAPNDLVRGPISRTLCAGYNRSTLLTNSSQPDTSSAAFYQDAVTNHYARKIHAQMADGKAYAFAFDDVGNHESLVNDSNPQTAYITLDPFS